MNSANLMQGMGPNLSDAVRQGVLWGTVVLGVYVTFRFLDIADLTVDGSFALGGCVCAMLIVGREMNSIVALSIATLAGMAAGFVTGILHTVFEIPSILAGTLVQISLQSINLQIMGESNNIPLLKSKSTMTMVFSAMGFNQTRAFQVIGIAVIILMVVVMYWFFGTGIGSALRAIENNEDMIRALGVNIKWTKLLTLMLSNGLVGISGALVCQGQKYANIQMDTRVIIIGLTAIVTGKVLSGWFRNFALKLSTAVIGSVIYFVIRASVIKMGMNPNYMELLSTIAVTLALCILVAANKWRIYKEYSEGGDVQY